MCWVCQHLLFGLPLFAPPTPPDVRYLNTDTFSRVPLDQ